MVVTIVTTTPPPSLLFKIVAFFQYSMFMHYLMLWQ